ncbi:MAG TPA: CHASE3 domain-containing protein [Oscillatoriaceae cyanobacterium M33_DOE_052]|uniref:Chemotaxis protein n=1 Tax=Planktothricoides sp. SpSt-374 TaxID=2282167 RepID=A0A7C3VEV9_9CYAN|nr:CHASE3 domain-containing protein [Oscillatoriaceae cyanobacterium M33_DOE_052]
MKINQTVFGGFGGIVILMLLVAITASWSQKKLIDSAEEVTFVYKTKANLNALEKALVDAETGQRGFLYTNDISFLDPYNNSKIQPNNTLSSLKEDLNKDPDQIKIITEIGNLAQQKMQELDETILLKKAGKEKEVRDLVLSGEGKIIMDEIRIRVGEMIRIQEANLVIKQEESTRIYILAQFTSWGSTLLVIIFGSVISWMVARVIMRTIEQAAASISGSARELAATVEEQERIANAQASSINQTTTTMDELNISANQAAEQAETSAQAARHVGHLVMRLSEKSMEIGKMNNMVTELANQTNMLALNAAVEAVRAGEQGRGFNVVAGEIRRLADQSKKSADNIGMLVSDIRLLTATGANNGNEIMRIDNIVTAANNIVLSSQQISLTAKQQAIAIQQVLEAMNAINESAQQTATGISQTKTSIQMLTQAAEHLKSLGLG